MALGNDWVLVCVNPYRSEVPGDTGRFDLPITGAVPHTDGGLSLSHLSTQLCHRVEADLLPSRVLKVLEQKKDPVMWSFDQIIHVFMFLCIERNTNS